MERRVWVFALVALLTPKWRRMVWNWTDGSWNIQRIANGLQWDFNLDISRITGFVGFLGDTIWISTQIQFRWQYFDKAKKDVFCTFLLQVWLKITGTRVVSRICVSMPARDLIFNCCVFFFKDWEVAQQMPLIAGLIPSPILVGAASPHLHSSQVSLKEHRRKPA